MPLILAIYFHLLIALTNKKNALLSSSTFFYLTLKEFL